MRTRAKYNAEVREVLRKRPYANLPVVPVLPAPIPGMRYCAIEDPLFPGTWRAEPIKYTGRGFVYLFLGESARSDAMAFAKSKNAGL
jgi:hypothetical protein